MGALIEVWRCKGDRVCHIGSCGLNWTLCGRTVYGPGVARHRVPDGKRVCTRCRAALDRLLGARYRVVERDPETDCGHSRYCGDICPDCCESYCRECTDWQCPACGWGRGLKG